MRGKSSIFFILVSLLYLFCSNVIAEDKKGYTIDELISIALEKNPSMAVFKANLEASKADVVSARAYPNPEVEFQGVSGKSLETGESKGEYSVGISQPVERPAKRFFRRKEAEAGAGAIEKDVEDFRLQLRSEVKKAFYQILLNKKAVETAKENLRIVEELLKTVEVRVKAGETPEFELVKAHVERLRADKDFKRAENRVIVSMTTLNALLGNALKDDFDIAGTFELPEKRYELSILLSYAMERHPLILKTGKEAEAKYFSLEKEKASISPDITVSGFSGRETDKESYGVSLSIPIPLWYQRRGEIARAFADKTRAEAEIYKIRVELSRAITEEYQNYLIALDQINVFEKGLLKQAEEALRIADLSYRLGESNLLEFLDAQRVNRSTLAEYYQSLFELETSIASLERTVGELP